MRVLVTDGSSRAALAITRSLGRRGHTIFVAEHFVPSLASRSRFCRGALRYADPRLDSEAFLDALEGLIGRYDIDLLLPVTDVCVLAVSEHRERFEGRVSLPLAAHGTLSLAADKPRLIEFARELGVATPRSITLARQQLRPDLAKLTFPVVIKPGRSRARSGAGWSATSVDYAFSDKELDTKLAALDRNAFPVLLQERVIGPGIGLFYCYDRGRCLASFAHRRLREKPPSGGVSVMRESVPLHPTADRFGRLLLDHLQWHGVAMVEFKLDERDQTPKLMEINGRFWGSLQLAIDAGVDFPAILAAISTGDPVAPLKDAYRVGVRSRWLWGELDVLLMYLSKSRSELKLPESHPSRLRSALQTLNPFYRDQHLEVLRLTDPGPWFHECACRFRR